MSRFKINDSNKNNKSNFRIKTRYDLSPIIQKVDKRTKAKDESEKIIRINTEKKEIVRSNLSFSKKIAYFLVSTQNLAEGQDIIHEIRDFATQQTLKLKIRYQVSSIVGEKESLVKVFCNEKNINEVIYNFIDKTIKSFIEEKTIPGVISNFSGAISSLTHKIETEVRNELKLDFRIIIELANEKHLENLEIKSKDFTVKIQSYLENINFNFEIGLELDVDKKVLAMTSQTSEIETFIIKEIKNYLIHNVSLDDICFRLNEDIKRNLKNVLKISILNKFGYDISYLMLYADTNALIPKDIQIIEHQTECRLKEYPTPIIINNKVELKREDVAKYNNANISDTEHWLKQILDDIIKEVFFNKTYVNVLLDLRIAENEIKEKIGRKAHEVGFSVRHILVKPQLKELELKDGFKIELDDTYHTKDNRVIIKLKTIFLGKITNLRAIEPFLNPNIDIKERIERNIHEEIEKNIHKIEPERAYMRFFHTDITGEQSVEDIIRENIKSKLENYHIEDFNLTLKPLETEITKRFQELQKGFYPFKVELFPLRDEGGSEKVTLNISFRVLGVDQNGWYTFQTNNFDTKDREINNIVRFLSEDLKAKLETIPNILLQYTEYQELQEIKTVTNSSLKEVIKVFGLVIEIITFRRSASVQEIENQTTLAHQITEEERVKRLKITREIEDADSIDHETYKELLRMESELILDNVEEDEEDLELIRQRIKEYEEKTKNKDIKKHKEETKKLKAEAKKKFSIQRELGMLPENTDENREES